MAERFKTLINFLKTQKGMALLLVLLAMVFNAILLWPEVGIPTMSLNDEVYHLSAIQEASLALRQGKDVTDFWFSKIELGYPLFHHYQHLPQTILAVIHQFISPLFSLSRLLDFSRFFLLVLYPLSIFWAMHRFGFSYLAGGLAALVASLFSTNGLFGLEYGSYVWRGFGLYPQLWAMFFLPLALAEIYHAVCKNKPLFWAVFLSTIVLLSHVYYGYLLVLSSVLFVFLRPKRKEIFNRLKNLILIFLFVGLITSYFFLPLLLDIEYTNRSQWIPSWKYDSFGAKKVLSDLFKGEIFDFGRFPCLTILFFLSLVLFFAQKSYKKENYRFLLFWSVLCLFLFFGRPTWGVFFNILPFSRFLQFHRFIGGFHLVATMIIGVGGALFWQRILQRFSRFTIFAFIVFLVILTPVYLERIKFCEENKMWRIENQQAFSIAKEELSDIEETLKDLPPARVYAGLPATWGDYPYYRIGSVPFYSIFSQWGIDSFGYSYHSEALSADVRLDFDDTRPEQYNLFNIRYVLLHKTWTAPFYYHPLKEFENYILYQIPTTGYFDLVDVNAVFYGAPSGFYRANSQWLFSSLPELKQHPIIEIGKKPKETSGLISFPFGKVDEEVLNSLAQPQTSGGEILDEKIQSNGYQVQFEASRETYLILKANYHPGWQVYLDNSQVSPVMLAPGFVGIKVQPGTHEALFVYEPPAYRFPLLVLGIFILSIMFFDYRKPFITKRFKKPLLRLNNLGKRLKINYLKTLIKKRGKLGDDVEKIDSQRL